MYIYIYVSIYIYICRYIFMCVYIYICILCSVLTCGSWNSMLPMNITPVLHPGETPRTSTLGTRRGRGRRPGVNLRRSWVDVTWLFAGQEDAVESIRRYISQNGLDDMGLAPFWETSKSMGSVWDILMEYTWICVCMHGWMYIYIYGFQELAIWIW